MYVASSLILKVGGFFFFTKCVTHLAYQKDRFILLLYTERYISIMLVQRKSQRCLTFSTEVRAVRQRTP